MRSTAARRQTARLSGVGLLLGLAALCGCLAGQAEDHPRWSYAPGDTWAFRPITRPAVPSVLSPRGEQSGSKSKSKSRSQGPNTPTPQHLNTVPLNPIDAFLLAKLRAKGLKFAPPADLRTLIRRATFDLTGLPPTPSEVDAFLRECAAEDEAGPARSERNGRAGERENAASSTAYERLVDRLLASPRYGERYARHWLDVVRYADTGGGSNDFERPNAWRYRDYVVRSFNQDKPYDRFVLEQLAGDELEPENPECLIATGFLRMGPWEHTGMSVEAITRQQWLDDVTNSTATTFLGVTAGCARCHDHKFDPIPTKEYYGLQAVFAGTRFAERPTPWLAGENRQRFEGDAGRIQDRLRRLGERLKNLQDQVRLAAARRRGVARPEELPKEVLDRAVRTLEGLAAADLERERIYRKWTQLYQAMLPRYEPLAFSVRDDEGAPPETCVLIGGRLTSRGEAVAPTALGVVQQLGGLPEPAFPGESRGRRLALARWIASPQNPLTARVIVNRAWQWHFGTGLVDTSNNLGKMGKRPSDPLLLDWLAARFAGVPSSGFRVPSSARTNPELGTRNPERSLSWSLKKLHRLIMTSAAYQQASASGAPNAQGLTPNALAGFPPRRLEAEELRDSILAVSGELSPEVGGPGTFPEINEDLARQPRQVMGTIAPAWEPSPTRAERNRRTIYTYQQRSMLNPLVEVFNGANPNDSCERRLESTVAPQVFNLFNSRFSHDIALAFARRVEREETEPSRQVDRAFRLAFGRLPTGSERAAALAHLGERTRAQRHASPAPPQPLARRVRKAIVEQTGEVVEIEEETDTTGYERNLQPADVSPETRALGELCLVLLNANEFVFVY